MRILIFLLLLGLVSCHADCNIKPYKNFDGDGILVIEKTNSEDGLTWVTFFPVCRVDTTDIMGSLQRSNQGIILQVKHKSMVEAIRNRALVLTTDNQKRPLKYRKIYLTTVHLSFSDTVKRVNTNHVKRINYSIKANRFSYEQEVINIPYLWVKSCTSI